jgi:hypothetical protein
MPELQIPENVAWVTEGDICGVTITSSTLEKEKQTRCDLKMLVLCTLLIEVFQHGLYIHG